MEYLSCILLIADAKKSISSFVRVRPNNNYRVLYIDDNHGNDVRMNRAIVDIAFDILKKREQTKIEDKRLIRIENLLLSNTERLKMNTKKLDMITKRLDKLMKQFE